MSQTLVQSYFSLKTVYDYDTIDQKNDGKISFIFYNQGKEPLIINDVATSCGCTVPSWSKKPVLPNQSGTIQLDYNTSILGEFRKTVVVYSNVENMPHAILKIKGYVKPQGISKPKTGVSKDKLREKKNRIVCLPTQIFVGILGIIIISTIIFVGIIILKRKRNYIQ